MSGPTIGPMRPHPDLPTSPQTQPATTAAVGDDQINQTAEAILGTGVRFSVITDDYDSRATRFAQEMAQLSPEDGARLVQSLLNKDAGALGSWMTLPILNNMHGAGNVSDAQYAAVSSAFAQAYNEGRISQGDAERFLQVQSLQDMAPAGVVDQWNQMRQFLGASDSPAMAQFREGFSTALLNSVRDGAGGSHTAGIAMQVAADSGDPDMPARVFSDSIEGAGGNATARETLLAALGDSSIGFRNSAGAFEGLVNPMATLIDSVAGQPNTAQWNDIAVGIARYAETSNDDVFFDAYNDDKPFADTAQSLTRLLAGQQGTAVMSVLTEWNINGVPGKDGHAQQFGNNAIQLGNLLRITAFNPDNPDAPQAMATVQQWTQLRKDFLNGVQRPDYPSDMSISQAREQLSMLGGASFDAVQQMKIDQDNRTAATEALVGFVIDLGVSVIPGGGTISGLVAKDLKATFGNNPRIDGFIDQVLSSGDSLTSATIDQLKSDIAGVLSDEQVDLEALRATASNFVSEGVVTGLSEGAQGDGGQSHRDIVKGNIQNVQDDIRDNRS